MEIESPSFTLEAMDEVKKTTPTSPVKPVNSPSTYRPYLIEKITLDCQMSKLNTGR